MIKQIEINQISEVLGVTKSQIDKDWVLSYVLYGIASMPELKNVLIFKGGTSLKKCWFSDYRFSEDLDFTILDSRFVFDKKFVGKMLQKATNLSFSKDFNRGILFKIKTIEPTISNNEAQGFKIFIHYWGADHRKNNLPSAKAKNWHHTIKLDINHTEEIIFPLQSKSIFHKYSDKGKFNGFTVNTYSIEEILSEKLRALIQRKYTSPRDVYDIWYLNKTDENINQQAVKSGFFRKLKTKEIEFTGTEQLLNSRKERILKMHWHTQLTNQFPKGKLPDYELILPEFREMINKLFR